VRVRVRVRVSVQGRKLIHTCIHTSIHTYIHTYLHLSHDEHGVLVDDLSKDYVFPVEVIRLRACDEKLAQRVREGKE
jgi:hypothetical protein